MTDCSSLCSSSRKPGNILCALLVYSMPFFDITCFCFVILSPLLFSRFSFSVCKEFVLLFHQEFGYLKIKRPILSCVFDRRSHSGCLYIFSIPFLSLWISVSPVSLPPPSKKKEMLPSFPHTSPPPLGLGTMQLSPAFSITQRPSPDESKVIGVVNLFTQRQFTAH